MRQNYNGTSSKKVIIAQTQGKHKKYPIQYLQELDTFQVHLCDHINIFGCEQVDNLHVLEGCQP